LPVPRYFDRVHQSARADWRSTSTWSPRGKRAMLACRPTTGCLRPATTTFRS